MKNKLILTLFGFTLCASAVAEDIAALESEMKQKAIDVISQMTVEEKISQLMNYTPGVERLGIKPYDWWSEALHGVARNGRATVFPQLIVLVASFDPERV